MAEFQSLATFVSRQTLSVFVDDHKGWIAYRWTGKRPKAAHLTFHYTGRLSHNEFG